MMEDRTNQNPSVAGFDSENGPNQASNTLAVNRSLAGTSSAVIQTNSASAMIWKLRSLCSRRPTEVEMRASSNFRSVLQRRLSCDHLRQLETNSKVTPKLRRCFSGPARHTGLTSNYRMPPLPNNTVENSPRPQIAIESPPKHRNALPLPNNNNSSTTNLRNNSSSTNLRNSNSMISAFETGGGGGGLVVSEAPIIGHSSGSSGTTSNGVHEILDTTNFNREIERLKTFEGWRVPFLSASQMAEAGFYYTKKDDIVRCAFCGVEVGSWVEGDNPMVDHQRWSPACRFLRKLPVGNVPLAAGSAPGSGADLSSDSRTASTEGYDTCGSTTTTRQYGIVLRQQDGAEGEVGGCGGDMEKLGIQQMRPPAYPAFSTYESRLSSYAMWPISLKLKPNVLSEAGFFYTGKGDQTICYYCGGGLKDWEECDVPWEEHAKWFNRCNYVLSIKGRQYVDKVCNKPAPHPDETGLRCETSESGSEPTNESEASMSSATTTSSPEPSTASAVNGTSSTSSSHQMSPAESGVESANSPSADSRLCKICFMEEMGILFLPCGHIVACPKCALLLTTCAVCRKPYSATVRAFLS